MPIDIVEEATDILSEYGVVPIAFSVESRYRVQVVEKGLGGWAITEEEVEPPYMKDYDQDKGEGPTRWPRKLFQAAAKWARSRGCRQLKIETQNINVPACKFYASQGCELRTIHPDAYPELPDEIQLLWYLDLGMNAVGPYTNTHSGGKH